MTTNTTSRLASGTIANSGKFWVVPTQGPRLTYRHDLLGPYRAQGSAVHVRDKYLADGIACEVVDSDERPVIEVPAHPSQKTADDLAAGFDAVADMLRAHPELLDNGGAYSFGKIMVSVGHTADPAATMTAFVRAAKAHGAKVQKSGDDKWFNVDLTWGRFGLHVYATRDEVCERIVVGTREVTEEIQDPEALAAVPTTTVTRTEDIVEWQCRPLLASEAAQA